MEYTLGTSIRPRILVVGDLLLDHTVHGTVSKLANEAPIPVFKESTDTWTLGGAGNVVANLAAMGCAALYTIGRIGTDAPAHRACELLAACGAQATFVRSTHLPTAVKTRYYCGKTLLFRHDTEHVAPLSETEENTVLDAIRRLCETGAIDTIVFSDYKKGVLTSRVCMEGIACARKHGVFTCVDPKDDVRKYTGCSLIKPNRAETAALFGVQIRHTDTAAAHAKIHEILHCDASVITLSEDGASYFSDGAAKPVHVENRHMEVIDVTGAGDIVCATLAYVYPHISDKVRAIQLATHFAMISVGHLGSYVLRPHDFVACRSAVCADKCISAALLAPMLHAMHAHGIRSVFTNGCFDIVHPGHLAVLRKCREFGDIVIVGLNGDASIRRLKGDARPIQSQDARAAFLSALDSVDCICVFEEDTPAELLALLRPTVLVKGGDYTLDQIVGRDSVSEVRIVPFVSGYSTTQLVAATQGKK